MKYVTRKNPKREWEASIGSSQSLNNDLRFIKEHAKTGSYREIIEGIIHPLAQLLANRQKPCGYVVYINGDQIVIQTYGWGNLVCSGKATAPLPEILGLVD